MLLAFFDEVNKISEFQLPMSKLYKIVSNADKLYWLRWTNNFNVSML